MSTSKTPANVIEAVREDAVSAESPPVLGTPEPLANAVEYELQDRHGVSLELLASAPKIRSKMRSFTVLIALYVSRWERINADLLTPLLSFFWSFADSCFTCLYTSTYHRVC